MRDNGRDRQRLLIFQRRGSGATFGMSLNQEALQPVSFPLWGGTDPTPPLHCHTR